MGRVTLESALGRRTVRTVLAAGPFPATLLLFGLGASGTPPLAGLESADPVPDPQGRGPGRQLLRQWRQSTS